MAITDRVGPIDFHGLRSLVLFAALGALGCGSDLASVTGHVTLDGERLIGGPELQGTVYFYPEGRAGAAGVGFLDSSGEYTIRTGAQEGVRPGAYAVAISATRIIMPSSPNGMPSGKPLTPQKYADARTSGLRVDVQPGSNEFDFDLVSSGAP